MNLIKTSLLNGIAVIVRVLTLLGINKILAIYVGPAGYAALGQFQNAIQIVTTFASGAINTGVTKYTAEYGDDQAKQQSIWRTAGTIAFIGSGITSIIMVAFSHQLSEWFLKDRNYSGVFIWFSAALLMFSFNSLLLAILNGKKEIPKYVLANISGSLLALIVTGILSIKFGLYGALIALATYQSIAFFVTFFICYKASWFRVNYFFGAIDRTMAIKLGKYTVMALTTACCVPLSHIFVRDHLSEAFNLESAGYWEAMSRLSAAYLMIITTTLSVYYLPKLSELNDPKMVKKEIIYVYKIILPIAVISGLTIYLLRDFIITLLFSKNFSPMRDLFAWQILGDILKIGSWILAYLMLAKAMTKLFILSEMVFSLLFYISAYFLTFSFGLKGAVVAHTITYGLYWIFSYYAIWKKITL